MRWCLLFALAVVLTGCRTSMDRSIGDRHKRVTDLLERTIAGDEYPGIQYIVLDTAGTIFEYEGGWADVAHRLPMTATTTMMAYSMTKSFTAAAVMQLVDQGKLSLDDSVVAYLPSIPYDRSMRVRHLLSQTSGIPDPIPLRWAHLAGEHASFDEQRALAQVLQENPETEFPPGSKYAYSNISYWLLGEIIAKVSGEPYSDYMETRILVPLGLTGAEAGFTIADPSRHAKGYLRKVSFMNLVKGFVIDEKFIGGYEGSWLHINDHYLNGPAFGGLVTTARGVSAFLRDQLREHSVLFGHEAHIHFFAPQRTTSGEPAGMTLGWHIGNLKDVQYFYKEGGGGGYHAEMRIYPHCRVATVIMVNETSSRCTDLLSDLDGEFVF